MVSRRAFLATSATSVAGAAGASTGHEPQSSAAPFINVRDYGAKGDGATDDTAAIQAAIDAATASGTSPIAGTSGAEIVGGGVVVFPPSPAGYKIAASIRVTRSKLRLMGPAKLDIVEGVTAFQFAFAGSHYKSGVVFDGLDFVGGAVAVSLGTNSVPMPAHFQQCKFINQTNAGALTGSNGFNTSFSDCVFTGCARGIDHDGASADGLSVVNCVFIYNRGYDIWIRGGNNGFHISNCDFVENQAATNTPANVCLDLASAHTAGYSSIRDCKFGPEGRSAGACVLVLSSGAANPLISLSVTGNLFGFDSTARGAAAIVIRGVALHGCTVRDNTCLYCELFDSAAELTGSLSGQNKVDGNYLTPWAHNQSHRGDWRVVEFPEPTEKINLFKYGRYIEDTAFTYANGDFHAWAATDESGRAKNAATFRATGADNVVRINSFPAIAGKLYTVSVWVMQDARGAVTASGARGSNYLFNRTLMVGARWLRITVECYQTYESNPFVFDLKIEQGRTIMLGGVTMVEGRDAGDLWAAESTGTKQRDALNFTSDALPSLGHFQSGQIVWLRAPIESGSGASKFILHGYRRLTTGSSHVLNRDWVEMRLPTGN